MVKQFFRRNASGLLLNAVIFGYYFSVIAEWQQLSRLLSSLVVAMPGIVGTLAFYALLFMPALVMKGADLRRRGYLGRKGFHKTWRRILQVVGYLVIPAGAVFAAAVLFYRDAFFKFCGLFFYHHHLAVFTVTVVVSLVPFALGALMNSDAEEFMDGFKTFPLLAPIACFTGPAVWKDALTKFGVTTDIRIPSILFFISGALLVCALLLFWIAKAKKKRAAEAVAGPVIVGPYGAAIPQATARKDKLFRSSAILSFVGMVPLFAGIGEVALDLLVAK